MSGIIPQDTNIGKRALPDFNTPLATPTVAADPSAASDGLGLSITAVLHAPGYDHLSPDADKTSTSAEKK